MVGLESLMERVFVNEQAGNLEKAEEILKTSMLKYPEIEIDIRYELGMMYFRNEKYYEALVELIGVYRIFQSKEIIAFIHEAFVVPNEETYRINYERNKSLLKSYPLFYSKELPDFYLKGIDVVWEDEYRTIFLVDNIFVEHIRELKYNKFELIGNRLFSDIFYTEDLFKMEQKSIQKELEYKHNPIYLYYDMKYFCAFLCICDIKKVLKQNRIVFLISKEEVRSFFEDLQAPSLEGLCCADEKIMLNLISQIVDAKAKKIEDVHKNVKNSLTEYYRSQKDIIPKKIIAQKPKILFFAGRGSTAVQYHVSNLCSAMIKAGLKARVFMEKTDIHIITKEALYQEIGDFKPDIVVLTDHFRFEAFGRLFPELVFLTWVQDPMPIIMDKATPARLLERDFILNHYTTWKPFAEVGYDCGKLIDAPVPGNMYIYKPYTLSEEEIKKYGCDICIVCHNSTIYRFIDEDLMIYENKALRALVKNMYFDYYNQVRYEEKILYSLQEFREYVENYFNRIQDALVWEKQFDVLAQKMYLEFAPKVYRQVLAEWMIEEGFANIKLWGSDWLLCEKFKPYAMGVAENGETLSKILQSSKIVIGNNNICTGAARVWETMLSGGFYMSNYVPEESDSVDLRKILNEEDFILFKSKNDLIEKINYFLKNDSIRVEMSRRGREKALKKMTFDALVEKIFIELPKKI